MKKSTKILQLVVVLMLGTAFVFAQNAQTTKMNAVDADPNAPAVVTGAENTMVTSIDESFEGTTFPPAGWTTQSPDGGTGWEQQLAGTTPIPGWQGGVVSAAPNGGQKVAFCTWTTGGASFNDQWLITPQITGLTATDSLTFWIYKFSDLYMDSLDILVSTTGNATANFTNVIAEIEFAPTDTGWMHMSYSLAAFAGSDIYIAFREHVSDNFNDGAAFFLDLVKAGSGGGGTGSQMWDLQLVIDADSITNGVGLAGAEFDGTNFLAAEWGYQGNVTVFRISPLSVAVDSFEPTWITGSSGLRDLAWDGTYYYGSDASTTIYQFTATGTLIGTITSPVSARAIAYDPINDAFWVNNFSSDLTLVSRTGSILNVISTPPSCYGMAYDVNSAGGPFLWLFTGTSSATPVCQVEQFNPTTGVATGVSHSVSGDIGGASGGIAGGLFTADNVVPGEYTLGGLMQTETDIFCYYLDMVVGTNDIETQELAVSVYPNPAVEALNISSEDMITRVELMNALGQMVYAAQVDDYRTSINVTTMESGVYFVRIESESKTVTRKVTVK